MRRLAISDIHGEAERLEKVLIKAGYSPQSDRLFLLGDYIDRGPDAKRTLEAVRKLVANGALALKGNHEAMMIVAARDELSLQLWLINGAYGTLQSFDNHIPTSVVEWCGGLPNIHEEPDCILVHGGMKVGVPLEQQSEDDLLWSRWEPQTAYEGKRVIFGHTPTKFYHDKWEPWHGRNCLAIDTGAVYGGRLTLVDIDSLETWTA
jgi:serine/threonine protein phosphatase 1